MGSKVGFVYDAKYVKNKTRLFFNNPGIERRDVTQIGESVPFT